MECLKQKEIDGWLMKGFIICALLFPAFYSPYTDVYQSAYYGGFSWAYFFLVLFLIVQVLTGKRKNIRNWLPYLGLLVLYNLLSLYFNYTELQWYWEQINNTVAFLAFFVLVFWDVKLDHGKQDHIRFLIHCIVLSNAASILYYFLGYTKLLICNNQFVLFELPADFYETRHYWIYSHKSEYALMLVAFISLFVAFREKFRNRYTYVASLAVLLAGLYLTHSWTGIAGVFLIFAGGVLDAVDWKRFYWKKQYTFVTGAVILAIAGVGYKILSERNIWTLGHRTEIWAGVWKVIQKYPQGWGFRFGESAIDFGADWYVTNAHNVFLNAMLRFSIPAGICFTLLFLEIVVYSVVKSRSFLAAGMWVALLMLLNMDYALMSLQMGLLFLIVYLVCFYKKRRVKEESV